MGNGSAVRGGGKPDRLGEGDRPTKLTTKSTKKKADGI